MANNKKISCIIFAFLMAGASAISAAEAAADADSEKANTGNQSTAAPAADESATAELLPCPQWDAALNSHALRRHHQIMRMIDHFFDGAFMGGNPYAGMHPTEWQLSEQPGRLTPNCEIRETKDAYVLSMEVPGIPKEAIKIDVEDNVLTISGEKKENKSEDTENYHAYERVYGSFSRSFALPRGTNPDEIKAECKDGLLTVSIAKAKDKKPSAKSIKVE